MKRILFILLFFTSLNVFSQNYITFSGVIKDSQTGEYINGVDIFVKEKTTGTLSDTSGSFFMFLTEGVYNIKISGEGYKSEIMTINLSEDKYFEIKLNPSESSRKKTIGRLNKKNNNQDSEIVQHSPIDNPS